MLTKDDYRAILRATDDELLVAYMILINSEEIQRLPKLCNVTIGWCKRMPTKQMELIEVLKNTLIFTDYSIDDLDYIGFNSDSCVAADILSRHKNDSVESLKTINGNCLATIVFLAEQLDLLDSTSETEESVIETIAKLVNA